MTDRRHVWQALVDTIDELRAADRAPVYVLVQRSVRSLVASGALVAGNRLPSVRELAERLHIAVNTVARAYAELAIEGVVVSRAGGGSVIADRTGAIENERLQRAARQLVAFGLALGHEPV